MRSELSALAEALPELLSRTGNEILRYYRGEAELWSTEKTNASPVTSADLASHQLLGEGLQRLTPGVPVLSEEGYFRGRDETWMWIVDPLDGTREFLDRTDQFCINVALADRLRPVLGALHLPVSNESFFGIENHRAWMYRNGRKQRLPSRPFASMPSPLVVAVSRTQGELSLARCRTALQTRWPDYEVKPLGSAIKFCELAKGSAHFYPRYSPTRAWDIAAGQALLEAAGGAVFDLQGTPLRLHAANDWRVDSFIGVADKSLDWSWVFEP